MSTVEIRPARRQADEVRCVCEIKAHRTYWGRKDGADRNERFHTISEPYREADGQWWVKVESKYSFDKERSVADMGVTSYNDGDWSERNYLVSSALPDDHDCGCRHHIHHCPHCDRDIYQPTRKEVIGRAEEIVKNAKSNLKAAEESLKKTKRLPKD